MRVVVSDNPDCFSFDEQTVWPSSKAEVLYLKRAGEVRKKSRVLHLLWRQAAEMLGAPEATPEPIWKEEATLEARKLASFKKLEGEYLRDLFAALRRLDNEAILEAEATNSVEEDLFSLRETLTSRQIFSDEARRLWIAQRKTDIGPISLAFIPTPSRQLGLFLENTKGEVEINLLLPKELVASYLKMLGVEAEIEDRTEGRAAPFGPSGQCDRSLRMLAGPEEALAEVWAGATITSPSPLLDWRRLLRAARASGNSLQFRADLAARDTAIGSYLLAREDLTWPDLVTELFKSGDYSESDLLWLSSARAGASLLEKASPEEFLEDTFSPRVWRGEGEELLFPGEVPAALPDKLIFCGLNAGVYPRAESPSLFFSEEFLLRHPELGSKDQRPVFVSALLAAREEIVLLRTQDASSFWLEAERVWGQSEESLEDRTPREETRRQIRSGARLKDFSVSFPSPEPPRRRRYSVSELESYLRCPLGWFVDYRVRPEVQSEAKEEGKAMHLLVEELFDLPKERATERILEAPQEWQGPLQSVLDRYGDAWPAREFISEAPLGATFEADGEEIELIGRADRIDVFDEGILVIDWKTGRPPAIERSLQGALYPWMAARRMQKEPLGFLFVSLKSGESSGLLTKNIPGLKADVGWRRYFDKATSRAKEAMDGIESGNWNEIGKRCPSWCSHRLFSRTRGF